MKLATVFTSADRLVARATGLDREHRDWMPRAWMPMLWALLAFGVYSLAHCAWYVFVR